MQVREEATMHFINYPELYAATRKHLGKEKKKRTLTFWQSFFDDLQYLYHFATPQPKAQLHLAVAAEEEDAVQGEAAALAGEVDPVQGQVAVLAAEAWYLSVVLAAIDADNASAQDVQGHQQGQPEAFAALEVVASLEVAASAEEAVPPEEPRAMD